MLQMDHFKLRAVTSKRGSLWSWYAAATQLCYVGNRDSREDLSGSALLTQPAETRYITGANPSNPLPAPFFAAQGFPPASAELAGYKNSGPLVPLPSHTGAGCWCPPLALAGWQPREGHRGNPGTSHRGQDHHPQQQVKGKRRSWGWSCPGRKGSTWEGKWVVGPETKNKGRAHSLSSAGRRRLNKANKKGHQTNFVLKPMNLDERPKGERLGCYQWHNFSSLLLKQLEIKPLHHNGGHFLQGGKHSKILHFSDYFLNVILLNYRHYTTKARKHIHIDSNIYSHIWFQTQTHFCWQPDSESFLLELISACLQMLN